MIDIHTHIMPGVDDGAKNLSMAIRMLEHAATGGTKHIILTPHCAPAYDFYNYNGDDLARSFAQLQFAVKQSEIPITIHPGMEILFENRKEFLSHMNDYFTLCGSRYFLIEYYFDVSEEGLLEGVDTVQECGCVPIIAHPERYESIQKNCLYEEGTLIREMCRKGALIQVNKGSLSGKHGADSLRVGEWLLVQDLVDFVASDAHHPVHRNASLKHVEDYIRKSFGKERAKKMFWDNPNCIIKDKEIHRKRQG